MEMRRWSSRKSRRKGARSCTHGVKEVLVLAATSVLVLCNPGAAAFVVVVGGADEGQLQATQIVKPDYAPSSGRENQTHVEPRFSGHSAPPAHSEHTHIFFHHPASNPTVFEPHQGCPMSLGQQLVCPSAYMHLHYPCDSLSLGNHSWLSLFEDHILLRIGSEDKLRWRCLSRQAWTDSAIAFEGVVLAGLDWAGLRLWVIGRWCVIARGGRGDGSSSQYCSLTLATTDSEVGEAW
ncbi:hypothetical protein CVT26_005913 [Gymnopilus dilepis]|uniref:Uncharacterized protein n=1 Tax=Gymnopilus dilepis TaxID=231916 RepID=A0A409Y1N3_9AGAR|nr:hypothetical protein CVT26_005913 [Gymnopilus dilepis]